MEKEIKKRTIIGIVVAIVILIGIIGITYGFYETRVKGNTNEYSFDLSKDSALSVAFVDGIQMMSFDKGYFFPGDSETKGFSVENTGNDDAYYTILLDKVKNEFERTEDLKYELYINNELIKTGTLTNEETQYIYYNRIIKVGTTDNVKFVLKYATTTESQNVDMNKSLSFRFNISDKVK